MGVKIIIHIHHIRGHTFDVEIDREADCIGLKIAIWDAQKIPVETQRLVFGGKEVADGTSLVDLGIDDDSTVFLVERVEDDAVPISIIQSQVDVIPVAEDSVSSVPVEPMSVNSQQYEPLPDNVGFDDREERIQSTVDLAFWVRMYCVFGIVMSLFGLSRCWGSVIPLVCLIIGYIGCRKLNRCCLVFPLLVSILIGPIGFVCVLWGLATHFRPPMIALLMVSFLHILIMASIIKLRCRIKHLSCPEKAEALTRVRSRRCCRS